MLLFLASLLLVTRGKDFHVLLSADSMKNANFLVINVEIIFGYFCCISGSYAAGVLFSTTPQSRNVSAGTMVEFTCAAPASGLTSFGISATPPIGSSVSSDLPNGDRQVTLSFIAPSDQTSINIVCVATTATDFNQSFAVLMIQGNVISSHH